MNENIVVRRAEASDSDDLRRLSIGFTPHAELLGDDEFRRRYADLIADESWVLAVAEIEGVTIGYAAAQDFGPGLRSSFTTGRIHDLFVDPASRCSGAGRALMNRVVDWARERPQPMILDWQGTGAGAEFYEALGFAADQVGDNAEFPAFSLDLRDPAS